MEKVKKFLIVSLGLFCLEMANIELIKKASIEPMFFSSNYSIEGLIPTIVTLIGGVLLVAIGVIF